METLAQSIEKLGGAKLYAEELEELCDAHAQLKASITRAYNVLHESLGQWRSYEIMLKEASHLVSTSKQEAKNASTGNRTRASRVAGENSTTEPSMLDT